MCYQCRINPVYEFTNKRKVCRNCFIKWFEKKFLYTIRKFNMLEKGDIVFYENKKDFCSVVLGEVLKIVESKGRIKLTQKKRYDKFAKSSTLDDSAFEILNSFLLKNNKNLKEILPIYKKNIKPLYLFLDKEILLYAKLKNLKFKKIKKKKDRISEFLNESEKKHPEIKRAIVNGFLKFQK